MQWWCCSMYCNPVKSSTFPGLLVNLLWVDLTVNSCRDRVEEEEAGGGRRVWRPDGRGQDAAGAGAGQGWCATRLKKKKNVPSPSEPHRGGVTTHGVHAQIQSNLGRLILKEEKEEKEKAVRFRRKTQSLPDRTHMHTSEPEDSFSRNCFCFCFFFCIFMGSDAFRSPQVCLPVLPNLLRTPAQAWPEWVLQRQLPAHLLVSVADLVRLRPIVLHNFKIH